MRKALSLALALAGALMLAAPASSTTSTTATTSNTAQWCAAVIRVNTQFGTMKNKRYVPLEKVTQKQWIAVWDYTLKHKAELLAITPAVIKKAMQHELAFFARLKATHWATTKSLAPMTIADVKQLNAFQRTQCGIKGI
jgi:Spy/CpxP family protein refolding chaperone